MMKTAEEYCQENLEAFGDGYVITTNLPEVIESYAKIRAIEFYSNVSNMPEILDDVTIKDFYNRMYDDWRKTNKSE